MEQPARPDSRPAATLGQQVERVVELSELHLERVREFLAAHGDDALIDALDYGGLFVNMRSQSRFSVRTAMDASRVGIESNVMLRLRPGSKTKGGTVEASLIMGDNCYVEVSTRQDQGVIAPL